MNAPKLNVKRERYECAIRGCERMALIIDPSHRLWPRDVALCCIHWAERCERLGVYDIEPDEPPCGCDCDDCAGEDERECGLEPIEIKVREDFDWQGMAKDLARSLNRANQNLDKLITALVECAEALHRTHWLFENPLNGKYRREVDHWQECDDPFCRGVADLLASLVQSDRESVENG